MAGEKHASSPPKKWPIASIANWRSPVLFVHGDDDRNVPLQQTTDLVEKLRNQKVQFEALIFPRN